MNRRAFFPALAALFASITVWRNRKTIPAIDSAVTVGDRTVVTPHKTLTIEIQTIDPMSRQVFATRTFARAHALHDWGELTRRRT